MEGGSVWRDRSHSRSSGYHGVTSIRGCDLWHRAATKERDTKAKRVKISTRILSCLRKKEKKKKALSFSALHGKTFISWLLTFVFLFRSLQSQREKNSCVTCETLKSVHPVIWTLIKPFKEENSLRFPLPSLSDVSLRVYQMVHQVQEISQFLLGEEKELKKASIDAAQLLLCWRRQNRLVRLRLHANPRGYLIKIAVKRQHNAHQYVLWNIKYADFDSTWNCISGSNTLANT